MQIIDDYEDDDNDDDDDDDNDGYPANRTFASLNN